MNPSDIMLLQKRVGVAEDGVFGRGTWAAVFRSLGAGSERARELALGAAVHVDVYGISHTPLRLAHFLAQLAHESMGFVYMEEIASGAAYEGRNDLGNVIVGDGRRYKGRGPIQLTGRSNYRRFGQKIGIDLESHPEIAALPSVGMLTACLYWSDHGLNELADADDILAITRRINGGTNGLADRKARLVKTKGLLL
ncbi:MAG TPA: glycoside hydrolase family 19 protein [Allosphingosinicella sp.]|nr:glycoside hydrolase family 19 protein [Allosphingosinicella sp.]